MSNMQETLGLNLRSYFDQIVQDPLDRFKVFITWTEKDKKEFRTLLDELKKPFDKKQETTKEKGDRLENLVEFIIRKTYFFEIYKNVHTETNEIDEVIVLSERGKQAIQSLNLARDLIPINQDLFLGECKNYESNLGVTYVGKFYSLLNSTNNKLGIMFSYGGMTGKSWGAAKGLTKKLFLLREKEDDKIYILDFDKTDFKKILDGESLFDILESKCKSLKMGVDDITKYIVKHPNEDEAVSKK